MGSLSYCLSLKATEQQIAMAVERLNNIRKDCAFLSLERVQIVCEKWSVAMVKIELETETSSCTPQEKGTLGACALQTADLFLSLAESMKVDSSTLFEKKQILCLRCEELVRMLVVCHTLFTEANTVGSVVKTLCEMNEWTTEDLWLDTIKVQLWVARRELEDAVYCIGGLESKSAMKSSILIIQDTISRLQKGANGLNYMMLKIGKEIVPMTPTIVEDINVFYERAFTESEKVREELCSSKFSVLGEQEKLQSWVREQISTLISIPSPPVPYPRIGESYFILYY